MKDLQDNLKAVRLALVHDVRAVRVSGWGEESQEFRFSRGGGGSGGGGGHAVSVDLRLRPPCGDTLEECCCSREAPPQPVEKGSLRATMAAAAAAALQDGDGDGDQIVRRVRQKGEGHETTTAAGAGAVRNSRKRRFLDDDDDDEGWQDVPPAQQQQQQQRNGKPTSNTRNDIGEGEGEITAEARRKTGNACDNAGKSFATGPIGRSARGGTGSRRSGGTNSGSTDESYGGDAATSSLDEIKRQMGKNPLDLVRSRKALEDEMLRGASAENGGSGSSASGRRTGSGTASARSGRAAESGALSDDWDSPHNEGRHGASCLAAADGGQDEDVGNTGVRQSMV